MTICILPWIHQAVRNNGDLRVCCHANHGNDRGLLRKDDGSIYNAKYDDPEESRNCNKLKDIRLSMLNGKWHSECIRCQREEASGIKSRFTYEKEIWNHCFNESDAYNITNSDGSIDINKNPVIYFDLRFGNKCNLSCRMCSPTDSDNWYKEHFKINGPIYYDTNGKMEIIKNNGNYKVINDIYNWYNSDSFWKYMNAKIPYIKAVHMVGGEPLLINQQYDFLKECIKQNKAKEIIIEYNTNATYIPDKILSLWKKFKEVKVGISLDGIGKVNDYIRYPSKWNNIKNNIYKIKNNKNITFWCSATISIYNILHFPTLLNWIIDQEFEPIGKSKRTRISVHPVHKPEYLNIKVLPLEIKKFIKKYFDNVKFEKFNTYNKDLLDHYSNFMFQDDLSERLPDFFRFNNKLDILRDQYLKDYIPELYNLLKKYDNKE